MPDKMRQNAPRTISQKEMERHDAMPLGGLPNKPKRLFACLFWLTAIPVMLIVGLLAPAILLIGAAGTLEKNAPISLLLLVLAAATCFVGLCGPGLLWKRYFTPPDPDLARHCLKCGKTRLAKGHFVVDSSVPRFVLTTSNPTNSPPGVELGNTVYVCTGCGVVKCALRAGGTRTLGPLIHGDISRQGRRCPNCHGTNLVEGTVNASRFWLEDLSMFGLVGPYDRREELECVFLEWACHECGCVIGRSNARVVRELIVERGTRALKRRLGL